MAPLRGLPYPDPLTRIPGWYLLPPSPLPMLLSRWNQRAVRGK